MRRKLGAIESIVEEVNAILTRAVPTLLPFFTREYSNISFKQCNVQHVARRTFASDITVSAALPSNTNLGPIKRTVMTLVDKVKSLSKDVSKLKVSVAK